MTDNTLLDQAMRIRYDLTAAQAKLTDLMETIAALNLDTTRRPRPGSPRELHPQACPDCEIVAGHTTDCPTIASNPNIRDGREYLPGMFDDEDLEPPAPPAPVIPPPKP